MNCSQSENPNDKITLEPSSIHQPIMKIVTIPPPPPRGGPPTAKS